MSIVGMNRTALMRARRAGGGTVPEEPVFAATGGEVSESVAVSAPLEALVRYIPAESIALYIALLGAVGGTGSDYGGRWVAFWIFLAATPFLVAADWMVRARRTKAPDPGPTRSLLAFNLAAATFAFAAWAFSLPASPFGQISWYDQRWAGFVALAAAIILAKAEGLFLPLD